MDVMIPSPAGGEFNFDSTCTSAYVISPPASPQRFGNYFFNDQIASPLSGNYGNRQQKDDTSEFTFNFSGIKLDDAHFNSADELFHGGKIKPLQLMPLSQYRDFSAKDSPKTPRSPERIITKALMSPKQKNKDCDPLLKKEKEENYLSKSKSSIRQKESKSSLTLNVSNMVSEQVKISNSTSSWYGKWKLTDILLFRSASEGHATSRRSDKEDLKNLSFRSADGSGSGSRGGSRRKKGLVSSHEWHYKNKRAAAEEMRRKTFLPYKKNLLGCMDLDPGVLEFSKGLTVEIKC